MSGIQIETRKNHSKNSFFSKWFSQPGYTQNKIDSDSINGLFLLTFSIQSKIFISAWWASAVVSVGYEEEDCSECVCTYMRVRKASDKEYLRLTSKTQLWIK